MPREVYVYRDGKLVPKSQAVPLNAPSHSIITDTMPETWHPADGKHYDSKSKFRRVTRARGCIEVGTERQKDCRQFDRNARDDVRCAIEMVRQGYRPRVLPESLE
jgi:hypothetical protein